MTEHRLINPLNLGRKFDYISHHVVLGQLDELGMIQLFHEIRGLMNSHTENRHICQDRYSVLSCSFD